jgi:hypothetical protein
MRWIYRRAFFLLTTFAAAIFCVRLLGGIRQPSPLYAILFENPDGSTCQRPCLFGVRPGAMTVTEAIAILQAHPVTRDLKRDNSNAGPSVYIYFSGRNVTARIDSTGAWIDLLFHESIDPKLPPTPAWLLSDRSLGDVINAFGVPDLVEQDLNYHRVISLYYYARHLRIVHLRRSNQVITPDDALVSITVFAGTPATGPWTGQWRGFASNSR